MNSAATERSRSMAHGLCWYEVAVVCTHFEYIGLVRDDVLTWVEIISYALRRL